MKKLLILSLIVGSAILMGFTPAENATSQTIAIGSGSKVIQDFNNLKTNVYTKSEINTILQNYNLPTSLSSWGTPKQFYNDMYDTILQLNEDVQGNSINISSMQGNIFDIYQDFARKSDVENQINNFTYSKGELDEKLKNIPQTPVSGGTVIGGNINIEETTDGVIVTNHIENGELIIDGKTLLVAYNQGKRTFHTDVDTPKFFMQKIYSMYFDGIENVTDMEFDIEINGLNSDIQYVAFPYVESKYVSFTTNGCQNTSIISNVTEYISAVSSDPNDTNKYQAQMEVPDSEYVRKDTYHIVKNAESNEMKWNVALIKRTNGTTDPYIPVCNGNTIAFEPTTLQETFDSNGVMSINCTNLVKRLNRGYSEFTVETSYQSENELQTISLDYVENSSNNFDFNLSIQGIPCNIMNFNINGDSKNVFFSKNGLDSFTSISNKLAMFNIKKINTGYEYKKEIETITNEDDNSSSTITNTIATPKSIWYIKQTLNIK